MVVNGRGEGVSEQTKSGENNRSISFLTRCFICKTGREGEAERQTFHLLLESLNATTTWPGVAVQAAAKTMTQDLKSGTQALGPSSTTSEPH